MNDYVIRFGNHWLVREVGAEDRWISDRSLASRFSQIEAEAAVAAALKQRERWDAMTFAAALADADETRKRRTRTAYYYAVEAIVRKSFPKKAERIPGVGCAPFAYWVDPCLAAGLTPEECVARHAA